MSRIDRWVLLLLSAAFLAWGLSWPVASLAGPGYVNFMVGQKVFDSDDWDPIDKQTSLGVEGVFGPATWPVQMDAYVSRASKDKAASFGGVQGNFKGETFEFGFGANKTWTSKKLRPYVNAGVVYAKVDVTVSQSGTSGSDDANGFGFWGGAGVFYRLGTTFNIGGAARYSAADVDFNAFTTTIGSVPISGQTVQAGGFTFGVLLGWSWPKVSP
jgi:hypothetical protein